MDDETKGTYNVLSDEINRLQTKLNDQLKQPSNPFQEQSIAKTKEQLTFNKKTRELLYNQNKPVDPILGPQDDVNWFSESVEKIVNPRLIGGEGSLSGGIEETVVSQLNYTFGDYGFKFEEADYLGDGMNVSTATGEKIYIDLDNFTDANDKKESEKLKKFLYDNKRSSELAYSMDKGPINKTKKYRNEKELQREMKMFQYKTNEFEKKTQSFIDKKTSFDEKVKEFKDKVQQEGATEANILLQEKLIQEEKELNKESNILQQEHNNFSERGQEIDKLTAEYYNVLADRGGFLGITKSMFTEGVGEIVAGAVEIGRMLPEIVDDSLTFISGNALKGLGYVTGQEIVMDDFNIIPSSSLIDNYDYYLLEAAKEKGYKTIEELPINVRNEIDRKLRDKAIKTQLYGKKGQSNPYSQYTNQLLKDRSGGVLDNIREGFRTALGETSTRQYDEDFQNSWLGQVYAGTIKSMPAILSLFLNPVSAGTKASTIAKRALNPKESWALIFQSQDAINNQMNTAEFEDVSETEKLAVSVPLALTTATLENIGFRNMSKLKGFSNGILLRALSKTGGKKVAAKTFEQIVKNEVKSLTAKGLLTMGAMGAAEFETGLAQEFADVTVKQIYNSVKGSEMFKTPESLAEYTLQLLNSGAQEAVGAQILGVPKTISVLASKNDLKSADNATWNLFTNLNNKPTFLNLFEEHLKVEVASKRMNAVEAKRVFETYKNTTQAYEQIPKDMSREAQKESVDLIMRRQVLEESKRDKNPNLVVPIDNEIQAIDNRLKEISEQDAVQKQSTGEVDADQQAADAQTVETGESTTESQELTGEKRQDQEADAVEGVTQFTQEQVEEINALPDEEAQTFTTSSLEEVPAEFRDRAELIGETKVTKKILGLPIGKTTTTQQYRYEVTGKELKDFVNSTSAQVTTQQQAETVTTPVAEEVVEETPVEEANKKVEELLNETKEIIELSKTRKRPLMERVAGTRFDFDFNNELEKQINKLQYVGGLSELRLDTYDELKEWFVDNKLDNKDYVKFLRAFKKLYKAQLKLREDKLKNLDKLGARFEDVVIRGVINPILRQGADTRTEDIAEAKEIISDLQNEIQTVDEIINDEVSSGETFEEVVEEAPVTEEVVEEAPVTEEVVTEETPTTQKADEIAVEDVEGQAAVEQAAIEEQMDLQELMELAENTLEIEIPKKQKIAILQQELENLIEQKEILEQSPEYQIAELMPKILPESARTETGGKVGTKQDVSIGLTSKKGVIVEDAAKDLVPGLRDVIGYNLDEKTIRNVIIDVLDKGKKKYQQEILGNVNESIRDTKQEITATKKGTKLRKKRKGQAVEAGVQEEIDNVIKILQKSFPSVTVSQTQEAFNEALKEEGVRRHQSGGTTILGITKDGKIILNPNNQSMATAIHEFGHVWMDYLRAEESGTKGTVLLNRGMKLMDDPTNPYYKQALKEYGEYDSDGNLTNKDLVLEEALVEAMANKGESYVKAAKKSKFMSWLKSLFKFVKAKLTRSKDLDVNKIKDLSLDEFIDVGIADLFSGKEVSIKFNPTINKKEARARAIKNGEKFVKEARALGKKDAQIAQVLKTFGLEQKDIDSLLGVKKEKKATVKKPPSVAKILGKPKPKKVTANEITLLKEKLRAIAKETRSVGAAVNKIRKELQREIAQIGKGRKVELSPAIVTKITSRINKAKLFTKEGTLNNEMVDDIVQYIDEQYTTLERKKENVALNKKRKTALKNIMSGKLGVPKVITRQMQRLFAADSILIPNSSLNKYKALVESIGERTSVLTVDEVSQVERQVDSILKDLDFRTSQIDIYAEMYKDYDKKVKNADGNISYSKTIDKMVDDAELNLSTEDAALMKKFKKEILPPPEPKTKEEKQKEEEEAAIEKELFLEEIGELSIKSDKLTTRDERKVANKLNKLIKTDGVKDLSNNDLKKLIKIIDNINNGWLPHLSQIMVEKINSNNRSKIVSSALRAAKVFSPLQQAKKLRALLNSQLSPEGRRKNKIYQAVSVRSLSYIDSVIGLKGREIFKNIFDSTAKAFTNFDSDNNKVNKRIDEALNKISKSYKNNNNKIHEAKARMMTYLIQREFESNPERVGEVNPAIDYLNDTIKHERKQGNDGEADMLQNIIDKYSIEGEISLDKIYKSFNKAELNGIKVIDEVNKELTDIAEFTAGVVRGKIISPIVDYIHMWVKQDNTKQQFEDKNSDFNSYMKGTKPSTKAKNLEERTKGSKAINFDPFGATRRGARMTLLDYHMTPVVRETNRTLRKTEDILEEDNKQTREMFRGVKAAYDQVVEDVIGRGFNSSSVGDNVIKYIAKTGYRTMLSSPARMTLEFITNLLNAGVINPLGFAKGFSVMSKLSGQEQAELLRILESKQQTRLYSDALKGRMVDTSIIESKTGIKNTKLKGEVINRASQIGSHLRKYPSGIEFIADTMITTPDKAVMRPLWLGTFSREFKKITGKEVDMDKVLAKDESYLNKNQEALDKATEVADRDSVFSGYTDNPFMKVISGTKRADDGAIKKMYKDYNRFMLSFLLNEYETTRYSINVLYEGGEISRIKAGQLLAATTSRMVLYTSLIGLVGNVFADFIRSMFGVDMEDEEEEKDLTLSIGQGLVSTFNTLAFGASYGQFMRSIINNPYFGTEYFNEKYLTALQEGEYDPYKDAIGFSAFTKPTGQEKYKGKDPFKFFVNFLGPYSPLAKTAAKGYTMLTREEEAKEEETKARRSQEKILLIMQGLGHFNLMPFFKDVNKAYTREVYKDFRKAEKQMSDQEMFQEYLESKRKKKSKRKKSSLFKRKKKSSLF